MNQAGWTSGLCECYTDCHSCWLTWCCPCISFGRIAEIVDKGESSCSGSGCVYCLLLYVGFGWLYACTFRSKLKNQYGMEPSTCADCCVHLCCPGCALCQEYRELQNRGFDLSLGWTANLERENRGIPAVPAGMMR